MDKLKIALICNGYGKVNRGAERYTEELYIHLNDIFDIDIYGIKETEHSFGTNTKFRDDIRIPWRNGRAYLEAYYFGRYWYNNCRKQYDVVLNNAGIAGSYWCSKYRKKTGTPFITFERGGGREEMINCLFKPDCMSFLTEYSQEKICNKKYLPKIKTIVLPIGIDLKEYKKKRKRSSLVDGLQHPLFLSTSAMVSFKRIPLMIKAIAKLDHGSLVQTSQGNMKDSIVAFGKKELGDRFRYVGVVSREELLRLYQSCDVFVNASSAEAFGVVYLEAMASGLPIVTQLDARRKEVVGDGGWYVDCEEIDIFSPLLAFASDKYWEDKPLQQAEKFSWDRLKPRYEKEILEVVN